MAVGVVVLVAVVVDFVTFAAAVAVDVVYDIF